jgi:hypothetical protein
MSEPSGNDGRPNGPVIEAPAHYTWPKYVLTAVALFFTVCIIWTTKEVLRLKRAKAAGMESGSMPSATTNR